MKIRPLQRFRSGVREHFNQKEFSLGEEVMLEGRKFRIIESNVYRGTALLKSNMGSLVHADLSQLTKYLPVHPIHQGEQKDE